MKTFKKNPQQQQQQQAKPIDEIQEKFGDKIKKEVMSHLKNVNNIYKVRVKHLWDHRWRVNVWCEHKSKTELSFPCLIVHNFKSMQILDLNILLWYPNH